MNNDKNFKIIPNPSILYNFSKKSAEKNKNKDTKIENNKIQRKLCDMVLFKSFFSLFSDINLITTGSIPNVAISRRI